MKSDNIPNKIVARFRENCHFHVLQCFSVIKEFLKKEVNGEIAFELINLFHLQIQQPTSRSTTTRANIFLAKFANFYYHKIFETISQ